MAETPKKKQALVVDDDAGTRNLFRLVLGPMGYRVVMATIDDDADTMSSAFLAGCNVYLIKPYNLDHVIELVHRLELAEEPVRLLSDRLGVHDFH